jgi:hypothetical protein
MKLCTLSKDGGPESTVWAYTLIEIKCLFTIVLLRFENGSRDAYHSRAFDCISWLLSGGLVETRQPECQTSGRCAKPNAACDAPSVYTYLPNWWPIITRRAHHHKVVSVGRSWVLSFRGPWAATWRETDGATGEVSTLRSGREVVGS